VARKVSNFGNQGRIAMKVGDIMIEAAQTCTSEASLADAAHMMRKYECGVLPVLDHLGKGMVLGMITDRDICMAVARTDRPASGIPVSEAISPHLYGTTGEADVKEALRMMADYHVRRLPVLRKDQTLEGIVCLDDILLCAQESAGREPPSVSYEDVVITLKTICRHLSARHVKVEHGATA
jgi:CBS domain-containing protein